MTIAPPYLKNMKILLLEGIHPIAKERLQQEGLTVELESKALKSEQILHKAKGFQALGIRSKTQVTAETLEGLKSLLSVGAFCIGTNQIELVKANQLGIPVFNAPYSNTRSVAELVISEMVALARQWPDRSIKAHSGEWMKSAAGSKEVRGKTLGIVGYGHIGVQLSILAEALGLRVLYYDLVKKLPLGNAKPVSSLEALLEQADFVSLHVPQTEKTKNMMTARELEKMKKGSYLINASRGQVVVIKDLVQSLKNSTLAGAAIDVFPKEPGSRQEIFTTELQGLSNVILTPHIGGSTEEAQEAIGKEVAESFIRFLSTGSTYGAVNFPQLDVPPVGENRRILNVHKNIPGVLSDINQIVSKVGANIRGQYLSTNVDIGYLVMDMEIEDADVVAQKISGLEASIKTRIVR